MKHTSDKFPSAKRALAGLALLAASTAWAHNPVVECRQVSDDTIICRGGFSDGSLAPGVKLDVVGYDDKVLMAGKLGMDSTLSFKKPAGEFFVLFDAGPGHIVEVDHAEIVRGAAPK
jgi:hypothetical protein